MPQLACWREAAIVDIDDDRPAGVERGANVATGLHRPSLSTGMFIYFKPDVPVRSGAVFPLNPRGEGLLRLGTKQDQ
jgi:hypothetical protein